MNYDHRRIEQLGHAKLILENTIHGLAHLIGTYSFRTVDEVLNIIRYTDEILKTLLFLLDWHEEGPVHIRERPAQLIMQLISTKVSQTIENFAPLDRATRLTALIEIKYDLKTVKTIIQAAADIMQSEWRLTQLN